MSHKSSNSKDNFMENINKFSNWGLLPDNDKHGDDKSKNSHSHSHDGSCSHEHSEDLVSQNSDQAQLLGRANQFIGGVARNIDFDQLRPISAFLGLGESNPYSLPSNMQVLLSRSNINIQFYSLNYLVVIATIAILSILTSPVSLLSFGALVGGWFYGRSAIQGWFERQSSQSPPMVLGVIITPRIAFNVLLGASLLLLALILKAVVVWTVCFGGSFVLGHSSLRDPNAAMVSLPLHRDDVNERERHIEVQARDENEFGKKSWF